MSTGRARAFWMAREEQQKNGVDCPEVNGGGAHFATLGRVNGCAERPTPWDAHAWAGLYCTLRDKRRGRSRTPGGSGPLSAPITGAHHYQHQHHHRPPPRSLTPSSLTSSSGRTTPTLSPSHGFRTTCWLEPRPVPVHYSSTVYMNVGSTKKRYVEEVTFQTRLVPRRFSESMTAATTIPSRHFTSVLEIQCLAPAIHVISLDEHQLNGLNGMPDEHEV